nr:peptide transporter [Cyclobacteriaceae bacterium]
IDWQAEKRGEVKQDDELGRGSLFATGLIAGGALAGVIVALLSVNDKIFEGLKSVSAEHALANVLGHQGYNLLGVACFAAMGYMLYKLGTKKD